MRMNATPADTGLFLQSVLQSLDEKLALTHESHDRALQVEATDHFLRGAYAYFLTLGKTGISDQESAGQELNTIRRMFEEALAHIQAQSDETSSGSREPGGQARPRAYR